MAYTNRILPLACVVLIALAGCDAADPAISDSGTEAPASEGHTASKTLAADSPLQQVNARLAAEGLPYRVFYAEYLTAAESGRAGTTVFFEDRGNKQLGADFVPLEEFSLDGTTDVSYYVDNNRPSEDLSAAATEAAIDGAMDTWDDQRCSDLGITKIPSDGRPTGFVSAIFGFGGSLAYVADVNHAGWLPGTFFDAIAPGGSEFILGVTFTIVFTDEDGNPTDVDGNGKSDVAFREIYYNDAFAWNIGSTYDVETVALHEAGHGLSQAHFGKAFRTDKNGKIHFAPRAVMNASYSGVQQDLKGTDNGGHCSNWGSWPNN